MSLDDLGPEVLRVLLLRGERELALDALLSLRLLELDDELAWGEPLPPVVPLAFVLVLELLKLLQRFLIDELSEGSFLHHFHRRQLIFMQELLPIVCKFDLVLICCHLGVVGSIRGC